MEGLFGSSAIGNGVSLAEIRLLIGVGWGRSDEVFMAVACCIVGVNAVMLIEGG